MNPENKQTTKKIIIAAAVIGVIILGVFLMRGSKPAVLNNDTLAKVSQQLNARLPLMVDSETRLDTTRSGPGKRLTYVYTALNLIKAGVKIPEFEAAMKPRVIENYKSNPAMQALRNENVELSYEYLDQKGELIAKITISPKDF